MTDVPILEVKNLAVDLIRGQEKTHILQDVSFSIQNRGLIGIIGESGSGKSVLCDALVRALHPPLFHTDGDVLFKGQSLSQMKAAELLALRGDKIGFIGSNPFSALDPTMTVGVQLVEKLRAKKPGVSRKQAKERVVDLLNDVRIPDPTIRFHEFPHQYSGGMIQRAMIVDALVTDPDLIIADNVTLPLDVTVAAQILTLFRELRERVDAAIIFASSSLPVAVDISDEIYVLHEGRIVEHSSAEKLLTNPDNDISKQMVESVPRIWSLSSKEQHRSHIAKSDDADDEILAVENIRKTYVTKIRNSFFKTNQVQAVRGVDFTIRRGESFGLVGESGCGKSTLSRLMTWLEVPNQGQINFFGKNVQTLSNEEKFSLRCKFQLLLQDPYNSIAPHLTIGRTITEPIIIHEKTSKMAARSRAIEVMNEVGLASNLFDELPGRLGAGDRQRVNIARALILKPELMILDETLTSLDHGEQEKLLSLFENLQKEHGFTYIYISHDLAMVRRACDRVAVMYLGKIVELGETRQIFDAPTHPYTKALLSALATIEEKPFKQEECLLDGEPPSPINLPEGCSFANRCPQAIDLCLEQSPPATFFGKTGQRSCHLDPLKVSGGES